MTLEQLMTLYRTRPAAVRLALDMPEPGDRLLLNQSLTRGKLYAFQGTEGARVGAHPETWARFRAEVQPLREAFLAAVERGGAA